MLPVAVDEMLGRLATWLRVLGVDAVYLTPGVDLETKRRLAEGRVFLTRNRRLTIGQTVRLESDRVEDQLGEAIERLGFNPSDLKPFSRCLRCNVVLERITPAQAAPQVPDYVAAAQTRFSRCPSCGRVYWPGSHLERMVSRLEKLGVTIPLTH